MRDRILHSLTPRPRVPVAAVVIPSSAKKVPEFRMMLCMLNDERKVIGQDDAELLLNDGILNRMKIKIEFLKGEA
jgi:hypothetical protein